MGLFATLWKTRASNLSMRTAERPESACAKRINTENADKVDCRTQYFD
jgi:hypothetical protein